MFNVLSFDFRVLSRIPGADERVRALLAPFASATDSEARHEFHVVRDDGGCFEVRLDGDVAHRARRLGTAIDWILWKASTEAIAGIRDHLAIHAGAVGWRGSAVLLPAPPDSGKTTLAAGLTAAGFEYFSDEAALLEPTSGRLVPFPRALWLEHASVVALEPFLAGRNGAASKRVRTAHVSPGELRRDPIARPSHVRHVVFPRYSAGSITALRPMSRAEALVELGRNAFNLDRFGTEGVDVLARILRDADVYRLAIGDLGSAVSAITSLVTTAAEGRGHASNHR